MLSGGGARRLQAGHFHPWRQRRPAAPLLEDGDRPRRKTTLMAMIITWQVLNAVTARRNKDFARAIFIVAPGITSEGAPPSALSGKLPANSYDGIRPLPVQAMRQKLNQVTIPVEELQHTDAAQRGDSQRRSGSRKRQGIRWPRARSARCVQRHRHLERRGASRYAIPADVKVSKNRRGA